uniref:Uncharacterized protein n=1 Tax=Lepeophtheirus salmonis TaxID=72036 RepID=A0A0K2VIA8_LEPSM
MQTLTNDFVNLISNRDNISVCEMQSKAWDLINEISKDRTDLKEALVKDMVLNCIPISSCQHLTQGFRGLSYEKFIRCARTEENVRTLKLTCYIEKERDEVKGINIIRRNAEPNT